MPVHGLTVGHTARLPQIGTLRKGAAKESASRPGADLDYWRFDTDDVNAYEMFVGAYGERPRSITILLPYPTLQQNWDAWNEEWARGGLVRRCDGQQQARWQKPDGTYSTEPKACLTNAVCNCQLAGRLAVVIPELERLAVVTVMTSSVHDIIMIQSALESAERTFGTLLGIPFFLERREREISMPGTDGRRVRRSKWLVWLEPDPDWVGARFAQMRGAVALPVPQQPIAALPAPTDTHIIEAMPDDDDEPVTVEQEAPDHERAVVAAELAALLEQERPLIAALPVGKERVRLQTDHDTALRALDNPKLDATSLRNLLKVTQQRMAKHAQLPPTPPAPQLAPPPPKKPGLVPPIQMKQEVEAAEDQKELFDELEQAKI